MTPHHENAVDMSVLDEYRQVGADGDDGFVTTLIDQYLAESAVCVAELTDAVARRDAPTLKRAAHSLKGSSGTMGARGLADICEQLEALARIPTFDGASALVTALGDEFRRVRDALEAVRTA